MEKHARAQTLPTLIQTSLQADASTFLCDYKRPIAETRKGFAQFIRRLARSEEELRATDAGESLELGCEYEPHVG